jgi:hypothetical protein
MMASSTDTFAGERFLLGGREDERVARRDREGPNHKGP